MRFLTLAIVSLVLTLSCGSTPTGPGMTLSFGRASYDAFVGAGLGVLISAPASISNVRCSSSKGDPVVASYGFVDWDLYMWRATITPMTAGERILNCTADPHAAGSVTINARVAPDRADVKVVYVRNGVPGPSQINPTVGGQLEINTSEFQHACSGSWLAWDPATLRLTCGFDFGRAILANVVNTACVIDPAHTSQGFWGGSLYVNDTLLTTIWQGSTRSYLCWLFTVDTRGVVGPPK